MLLENRYQLCLFCKEAINNAIKYSNASLLELYIKEQDGNIEISLKDDGDGFDMETVNRGNGLDNMQQRAREMQTNCSIISGRGNGTHITISVKNPFERAIFTGL